MSKYVDVNRLLDGIGIIYRNSISAKQGEFGEGYAAAMRDVSMLIKARVNSIYGKQVAKITKRLGRNADEEKRSHE